MFYREGGRLFVGGGGDFLGWSKGGQFFSVGPRGDHNFLRVNGPKGGTRIF